MASLVQVCLALLLVSCVHGQQFVGYLARFREQCSSQTVVSQSTNCLTAYYNAIGVPSGYRSTTKDICDNIPAWASLQGCTRSAHESCLPSEYLGLLPTEAIIRDSYQYYCDHMSEMNIDCVGNALSSDTCTQNATTTYNAANGEAGLVQAACNYLEAVRRCLFNFGPSCLNHNRNVYDTYFVKSYPPACAGGARRVPTCFLLLGACAVLLNKVATVFLF